MPPEIRAGKGATGARPEPKPFRAGGSVAAIKAAESPDVADGKPKLATFTGRAYTGQPMTPQGWWTPVVIDLAGVRARDNRPALRQHDHEQIVGHTTAVKVTADGIDVEGVFSGQPEHVAKVTVPAINGFQWQLSVGADPVRTEFLESGESTTVNGREVTGPLVISRETELGEVSFVPLGADGDTSATVSASKRGSPMFEKAMLKAAKANGNVRAAKYSDADIDKMSDDEAKAALKECMKNDDSPESDEEEKKADAKAKAADDEEKDKEKTEAKAAGDFAARLRAQAGAEIARHDAIRAAAAKHNATHVTVGNQRVNLVAHAIEKGWTADQTELAALRGSRPAPESGGPLVYVPSKPDLTGAVLEAAVFQAASPTEFRLFDESFYQRSGERGALPGGLTARIKRDLAARYTDEVMQAAHTHFKGRIGLQQLLVTAARGNGHRCPDVIRDDDDGGEVLRAAAGRRIQADGGSSYSLSNLLANVLGKMMLGGYLFTEQAWRDVAGIRPVKDFKPTKSINLFGDIEYAEVGSTGELKNATLSDQAFANQAGQYGRIMTIDRKAIINDDLGALTSVPMLLGRGAGLKLNKTFWTTLLSPGNDNGGSTAFFAATHTITGEQAQSNYQSGGSTALSSDALKAAVVLFNKQVDPAGYPLGIDPEILLYPPELDVTARELMNAQFLVYGGGAAAKQPNTNIWQGRFKPVMSRYLSNAALTGYSITAWYLFANPGLIAAIECAFLNGVDVPTVQQAGVDYQFDRLGISIRGVFDFGVTMQNFRGGVKSAGA